MKKSTAHVVWHKFSNWLIRTYGKDLHGDWIVHKIKRPNGKILKIKTRSFNDAELNRRLVGYEVMRKIEKYINRSCPEIKIVHCDDSVYAGSNILLIPHPNHGITIMFIPQCTSVQNQFFLYKNHFNNLMDGLKSMRNIAYK